MRTTLAIDDRLLAASKIRAASRDMTLGQFVEDALRRSLTERPEQRDAPTIPVFTRGTGMRKGLDPASNRSLYDALDASGDLG